MCLPIFCASLSVRASGGWEQSVGAMEARQRDLALFGYGEPRAIEEGDALGKGSWGQKRGAWSRVHMRGGEVTGRRGAHARRLRGLAAGPSVRSCPPLTCHQDPRGTCHHPVLLLATVIGTCSGPRCHGECGEESNPSPGLRAARKSLCPGVNHAGRSPVNLRSRGASIGLLASPSSP